MESTWKTSRDEHGVPVTLATHQTPTPTPFKRGHQLTEKDQFSWSWTRIFWGVSWAFRHDTNFHGPGWPPGRVRWVRFGMTETPKTSGGTVDGRNPAPVDMENPPLFSGFYTSQVVQDFFHQQYDWMSAAVLFLNVSWNQGTQIRAKARFCGMKCSWMVLSSPLGEGMLWYELWHFLWLMIQSVLDSNFA